MNKNDWFDRIYLLVIIVLGIILSLILILDNLSKPAIKCTINDPCPNEYICRAGHSLADVAKFFNGEIEGICIKESK